jgi:hypothetical protein
MGTTRYTYGKLEKELILENEYLGTKLLLCFSIYVSLVIYKKLEEEPSKYNAKGVWFFIYNSMQKVLVCEERVHVFYPKELFPIRAESKSYLHYIQLNVHKLNTGRELKGQGKARRK